MRVDINRNLEPHTLQCHQVRNHLVVAANAPNEFLNMINTAYNCHLGIEISPDDINLIICYYLAQNVNKYPEHYREFLGQPKFTEIQVHRTDVDFDITIEAHALGVFDEFIEKVAANNPDSQLNALTNDFSTTTPITRLCSQVLLAYMVKKFYGLHVVTKCGIPYVDIAGTTEDWQKIKDKLRVFRAMAHPSVYGYIAGCEHALDYFIAPYIEAFHDFYQSGFCESGHNNYSGFILKFFDAPWPNHNINEIPSTRIEYRFKLGPLGTTNEVAINAGPVGAIQAEDGTLKMVYDYYFDKNLPSFTRMSQFNAQEVNVDFGSISWNAYNYRDYRFNGSLLHDVPQVAEYVNNPNPRARDQGKIIFDGKLWLKYRENGLVAYRRRITFDNGQVVIGGPEIAPISFLGISHIWQQNGR